ncbi:MAG TPA: helix-turn-helix domain-containing protein [Geminicoccaceae bacterium]
MVTTTRPSNVVPCHVQDLPEACRSCPVRDLGLCAALDDSELAGLQRSVWHVTFEQGQAILTEGEPARHIFIVIRGAAVLQKSMVDGRRQITSLLLPGDVLGTGCDGTYGYSAEALVRTELCRIPNRTLDQLCARYPHFERHLRKTLGHELCEAQSRLLWLGRKTAAERLASFLLMLAERAEHRGAARNPVRLLMTRNDIADCLGLTEETVSRTFTQLVNRNLIRLPRRGEVLIVSEPALRDLAEGQLRRNAGIGGSPV